MEQTLENLPMMRPGPMRFAREGIPFLAIFGILALVAGYFFWPVGVAFGLLFAFTLYFFRDPERQPPGDASLLVSPADGKVLKIEELKDGPLYPGPYRKVSIFMSPMDVHVNTIPCDGTIREVRYHAGKFFVASLDKASEENERNSIILDTISGKRVAFTQIAGLVARRIVCYAKENRRVQRGERYGLIRFGSRMEVCFPVEWPVLIEVGQKVTATATALAKMSA